MICTSPNVLVLAGDRGDGDAVARMAGVESKVFAPVAGVPMLERVVAALRSALPEAPVTVAIAPPSSPESKAVIDRLRRDGRVELMSPAASPARTVAAALPDDGKALLVVTADHALLTPAMVRHFLTSIADDTNAAVGVANRVTISAAYPETRRTYWHFADHDVSGCNLFLLNGREAAAIVQFWITLERDRKRPWVMIRRLGPLTLLRFALGRLRLYQALDRLGQRVGGRLEAIDMPFAEAAMDVDRPGDLILAEQILNGRTTC
ncbi:MAG: nucleotidyltransferase family protein [Magnetospirillum sp.]